MPYKKSPGDATEWYMNTYCNNLGKDNLYCGCLKNSSYGNYCGKHKSNYLINPNKCIILKRFNNISKDYNKTVIFNTIIVLHSVAQYTIVIKYFKDVIKYDPESSIDFKKFLKNKKLTKDELFIYVSDIINMVRNYNKNQKYYDKIDVVVKLQSYIRKILVKLDNKYKGPSYLNRKISCNEEDFYSFCPLNEIEDDFFFSYEDKQKVVWSFDIRSLKKIIDMKQGNPYNRDKIPKKVKKLVLKRLQQLENRNVCVSMEQAVEEDINSYIKHRCIDIIQHINQFGYHVEDTWILSLNLVKMKSLYANLEDIWNYRAQLSPQVKRNICPPTGVVFNKTHGQINGCTSLTELQKIILDDVYKLVFSGIIDSDQKLGAMYFLIGLGKVNTICYECIPWLQYV